MAEYRVHYTFRVKRSKGYLDGADNYTADSVGDAKKMAKDEYMADLHNLDLRPSDVDFTVTKVEEL